jgi:TRAP transporter TAXI family solute receptor
MGARTTRRSCCVGTIALTIGRRLAVLLVLCFFCLAGCVSSRHPDSSSSTTIRLASYDELGRFQTAFAEQYRRLNSPVRLEIQLGKAEVGPGRADIAIMAADAAYDAHRSATKRLAPRPEQLRAIASLHVIPFNLLVRAGIRTIEELRGGSLAAIPGQFVERLTLVAEALHMRLKTTGLATRHPPTEGARLVSDGSVDAVLVGAYFPTEAIQTALHQGARLLPLEGPAIDHMQAKYLFLRDVSIPPNVYIGQERAVHTIGVDTVVVCRSDLDVAVVHELTQRLFEVLPRLSDLFIGLRGFDVTRAAAAPIPLHEGAARYYRERELLR